MNELFAWTQNTKRRGDLRLMMKEDAVRLNLGSGPKRFHKPEFINIDISQDCDPDLVLDLEHNTLPFEDDTIIEARADNLLEHFADQVHCMNELHRVLRSDGVFWFRVPAVDRFDMVQDSRYISPGFFKPMKVRLWGAFRDPTHQTFFCQETMDYWNHEHPTHRDYGRPAYGFLPWEVKIEVYYNSKNGLYFYDVTQSPVK